LHAPVCRRLLPAHNRLAASEGLAHLYLGAEGAYHRVWAAFTEEMRRLGWNQGDNIVFERRFGDNKRERLAELAAEVVRLNVDVILTSGTAPPIYAKQATSTIPIVFIASGDPVGTGLVSNLARPGGNVTGFSAQVSTELGPKRLQLLKDAFFGTVSGVRTLGRQREQCKNVQEHCRRGRVVGSQSGFCASGECGRFEQSI
jgi:hypothetical protein